MARAQDVRPLNKKLSSLDLNDEDDVPPIYKLNDDCIREIFSYLTRRQLIGIARVCKKWYEISSSLWSSINNKQLIEIAQFNRNKIGYMKTFEEILKRHGKNLSKLNLLHFEKEYLSSSKINGDIIVVLICKYCENLKTLKISGQLMTVKGFQLLEKYIFPNLEAFKIDKCDALQYSDNKVFRSFMQKAPKLKSLSINKNHKIDDEGPFFTLNRSFKKLELLDCDYLCFKENFLAKLMEKNPNLAVLKIMDLMNTTPFFNMINALPIRESLIKFQLDHGSFFREITDTALPFPNLRCLYIRLDYRSVDNQVLARFSVLFPKLEKFKLSEYHLEDDEEDVYYDPWEPPDEFDKADRLAEKAWLEELGGGRRRDGEGIKELAKCPNLKYLGLIHLYWLTGDALVELATATNGRFETLNLRQNDSLRDAELIKVVSLCPRLTHLDVAGCKNLTKKFLTEVLKLMDKRTNKKPLNIKLSGYKSCDYSSFINRNPLLTFERDSDEDGSRWW